MSDPRHLQLPIDRADLRDLRSGDEVLLSGSVFTARDATHRLLVSELERDGSLPFDLAGQVLFYAGPTPPKAGRAVGSVGPTTSKRMDPWTPQLLEAGIVAAIGKGLRSEDVVRACAATGSIYFAAIGGIAALLGTHVAASEVVAYPELGTEALTRLELDGFPVVVAIDTLGNDLYREAPESWRREVG